MAQSDYDGLAAKNKEYCNAMRATEAKLDEVTKRVAQLQEENARLKAEISQDKQRC